jgi:peptidoglycan/xylan/chitin deacetylase (PgdA/CDA1 family)
MSVAPTTVAFTIDLEPDCPPFLRGYRGIEQGLPALLDLLSQLRVPATFFTTGEVAERFPRAVEQVDAEFGRVECFAVGNDDLDFGSQLGQLLLR